MRDEAARQEPLEVAPDTFLIRAAQLALGGSLSSGFHSLLIRGAEPVVVDTGMITHRSSWFEDLFALVEPDDVRWLYLTHDDVDHAGNLVEALARCPNARVVTSWAASGRTSAAFGIPPERIRTVDHGEPFDVGDRTLRAFRPPVYDSPYTRGLLDPTTRVYHAADAFCTPMPAEPVDRVDEIPARMWEDGMALFHHGSLSPWLSLVDAARFRTEVEELAGIGAEVIVGAHTPVIPASSIARAFELLAALPSADPPPLSVRGADRLADRPDPPAES